MTTHGHSVFSRTLFLGCGGVLPLVLILAVGCDKEKKGGKQKPAAPAVAVTVAEVVRKSVPVEIRTFGTVEASASVAIKAQIGGALTNVHFRAGQEVLPGDLLLSIDARPAEAALKRAEADLCRDVVQQKNAVTEAGRQEELFKKGLASQEVRDQAATAAEALTAAVKADEATVDGARLELAYCAIRSPIAGRTGKLLVDVGNVIKANDLALLTVNQIKPVYVNFAVPQRELSAIQERMGVQPLAVRILAANKTDLLETGILTFLDNEVKTATGTIQLRGTFANANGRLWPGQFVSVVLTLSVQSDAVVVPSVAVQTSQSDTYVFVVKPDMTAENRSIKVSRAYGDETVIAAGLEPGERVVTDGQFRLSLGSKVDIKSATKKSAVVAP
jgi:multidrug efflux system membrane fusion protein